MRYEVLHPWDVTPRETQDIQRRLAPRVSQAPSPLDEPRLAVGLDLSPPDRAGTVCGAVVVVRYPSLEVVEVKRAFARLTFPYVPGLLSFREAPAGAGASNGGLC